MPTEVPKIVTRLQLENSLRTQDHTITIAELVKIFGDEHKDLDYPDKAENSQLSEAFDYIINNQKIAENLCEILDMSNDFEECLGIREIS